jgi:hypothetical protein
MDVLPHLLLEAQFVRRRALDSPAFNLSPVKALADALNVRREYIEKTFADRIWTRK